jgi:M6 family metalloprotease-like protein
MDFPGVPCRLLFKGKVKMITSLKPRSTILPGLVALFVTLGLLFSTGVAQASGASAQTAESLSGWFTVFWGDGVDGVSTATQYFLNDRNDGLSALTIDDSVAEAAGGILALDQKWITVDGEWSVNAASDSQPVFQVQSITAQDVVASSVTASSVSGSNPWVSIMCKFGDVADEPKNWNYFQNMYSSSFPGLDYYWREVSYNIANVAGSAAAGWYTLPHPRSYYVYNGGLNFDRAANDCTIAADADVDFGPFVGINLMFNDNLDGYAWGGSHYMTLDGTTKTWRMTWEPPWGYEDITVIAHEMGHGFGLPHSSGNYGQTYDNQWDVMSNSWAGCNMGYDHPIYGCLGQHTISFHKDILGWIPEGKKYLSAGGSATITLEQLALPQTGDYLMAQIPIGGSSTHFYTVEVRRKTGFDVKLLGQAVIIHEVDTTRGISAHVIDIDGNGNTGDSGAMWTVGETFTDPTNNILVYVASATATGFQVTITLPPAPFSKLGPDNNATGISFNPRISWEESDGTVSYEYCYDTSNDNLCSTSWSSTDATAYADLADLAGLTNYYWQVRVNSDAGTTYANAGNWWKFTTIPCYTLATASKPNAGGTVSVDLAPNCAGGKYISGTVVNLTATANPAYLFSSWSGSITGTSNPVAITMNGNKTITGNFTACYSLSTSVSGGGGMGITPAPNCAGGLYKSGTSVTLTATANPANYFSAWSGGLTGSTNPSVISITANKSIVAAFVPCFSATVVIAPASGGTVTRSPAPNCAGSLYKSGTVLTLTAKANAGYAFNQWQNDASGTALTATVTMNADKFITAQYIPCYAVIKTASPATGGSVSVLPAPNCAGGLYKSGTTLTFSAAAATGHAFLMWSESVSSVSNPYTPVTAIGPVTITANFVTVPTIPSMLTPVSSALVTIYTPTFDWSDSTPNLDHYQFQVATDAAFTAVIDDQLVVSSTYTPIDRLPSNTILYWRVRSFDSHGFTRGWTAGRILRTALLSPSLTGPATGEHALTPRPEFSWNMVTGASGYTIQISKNAIFTQIVHSANLGVVNMYVPTANLSPAITLYWRVHTTGLRGPSAWSEVRSFHSANPPSTPTLLLPANGSLTTNYRPLLDWGSVSMPTGTMFDHYNIQVADNAGFVSPVIDESAIIVITAHQFIPPSDLTPNTKYYWRVRSYNTNGEYSIWSAVRSFRTAVISPTLVAPADTVLVPSLRPTFDWSDVSGASGYTLQISKNGTFTQLLSTVNITGAANSQSTSTVNLPTNIPLYWRVRANGVNGPSLWSSPVWSFTVTP